MNLVDMQAALRIDLADDTWDAFELSRGVIKAVADLSRFLPDEKVYEHTFVQEVTSEPWTSADAHGTYKALVNKPIKWDSETVKSSDGATTYTRDTHYTMDYMNGEITTIDVDGGMAVDTAYLITYTKSREAIDISSLTDLIRVRRVEYPLSTNAIMEYIPFSMWKDILYIAGEQLIDRKHLAIYYEAECVAPTSLAAGSYNPVLNEVILKGAAAYAIMSRGMKAENDAKTAVDAGNTAIATMDKTDAETALGFVGARIEAATTALAKITSEATAIGAALGGIGDYLTSADAALDKVTTHVTKGDTALDKVATYAGEATIALGRVATEVEKAGSGAGQDMENINTLLTAANTTLGNVATKIAAMETALGELAAMWTDEETFRTAAKTLLESGDDYINKVNVGDRVADLYGTYAQIQTVLARLSENRRTGKITEATTQLSAAAQYISEANSRTNLVNGYISEARERVNQARAYIEEAGGRLTLADRYVSEAGGRVGMADRFINEASGWVALADRKVSEANARLGLVANYVNEASTNISQANGYIAEAGGRLAAQELVARQADTYNAIATQQMALAERYLREAVERRNEFWAILRDKNQMRTEYSMVAQRQPL